MALQVSKSLNSPVIESEYDYDDSIIIQPIRKEDLPPQLCVLSFPFDPTSGGKI